MSNHKEHSHVSSELEQLTEHAVDLAKQRRQRELSEEELTDVQGGGLRPGGLTVGYFPANPSNTLVIV